MYCQQPLNQYIPDSAERAVAEKADDKARLTAMLWGTAAGKMGPLFGIIKCSSTKADLTNTRVSAARLARTAWFHSKRRLDAQNLGTHAHRQGQECGEGNRVQDPLPDP